MDVEKADSTHEATAEASLSLQLTSTHEATLLGWQDVSYSVITKKQGVKQIIDGQSGSAEPGKVLAIMGSSGAGKTTLLNVLSGRMLPGTIGGSVHVNGAVLHDRESFRRRVGFVQQDDLLMQTLTPKEALTFSASLRLPRNTPSAQVESMVDVVVRELGLTSVKDSIIGAVGEGGISGGERKRVSIGQELVTDPSLLFVDEPTSGLDAYNALKVPARQRPLCRSLSSPRPLVCACLCMQSR